MTDKNNQKTTSSEDTEQPFIYHLIELRDRLLRIVLVVAVVFLGLMPFSNTLFTALSGPLMSHMPKDSSMIAIEVASPFLIPLKLTLFLALFIAIPYVLYQLWSFVAPGLYRHERRLVFPLLVSSTVLFYAGAAFAYFVVFPLVFAFFTSTAPEGVSVMTDISRYLDFVLTLFFAFGAAFEVPVITVLLVWTGIVTQDGLRQKRPYIIVGAFVIGMLLTPPDVISQTLLAVPVWLLFELGVYFSGWFTSQAAVDNNKEYRPMSESEMDAELDRIEAEDKDSG
jgi:sec-independent protein translocase protein TatC